MSKNADGPLSNYTIVDLTRILAGPWCTRRLADLGARVIKVEKPPVGANERPDQWAHAGYNYGKESIALDWMNVDQDKEIFFKLLDNSDVLIENFRAGTMAGLGLTWEYIHARWPKLIYCSISGYGSSGPNYQRPAMDPVIQGSSGIMAITGNGDQIAMTEGLGDINAGLHATIGIQAALLSMVRDGEGRFVDISMNDAAVTLLQANVSKFADPESVFKGGEPVRDGTRGRAMTPFQAYYCGDGKPVCIVAYNRKDWPIFCQYVLEKPELEKDERFRSNGRRLKNIEALTVEIENAFKNKTRDEVMAIMSKYKLASGPVNSLEDVFNDEQLNHRNMLAEVINEKGKKLIVPGNPIKISGFPDSKIKPNAPALDEHGDKIRSSL